MSLESVRPGGLTAVGIAAFGIAALGVAAFPSAQSPSAGSTPTFRKVILDGAFRAEGVALADVDRDGRTDVLAGNAWYAAPAGEAITTPTAWARHAIAPLEP